MNEKLFLEMIKYYGGDPKRIQHFTKVNSFCKLIGELENVDENTKNILDISSLVHDIGIKKAEELYGVGNCGGRYQEELGPDIAKELLTNLGYTDDVIERVGYLVGHHHTYSNIEGIDYQILVEADFLVNLYEDNAPISSVKSALERIFKTEAGKRICSIMFHIV